MDNYQALALAGNRQAQLLWLALEVAGYENSKSSRHDRDFRLITICHLIREFKIPVTTLTVGLQLYKQLDQDFMDKHVFYCEVPLVTYYRWKSHVLHLTGLSLLEYIRMDFSHPVTMVTLRIGEYSSDPSLDQPHHCQPRAGG